MYLGHCIVIFHLLQITLYIFITKKHTLSQQLVLYLLLPYFTLNVQASLYLLITVTIYVCVPHANDSRIPKIITCLIYMQHCNCNLYNCFTCADMNQRNSSRVDEGQRTEHVYGERILNFCYYSSESYNVTYENFCFTYLLSCSPVTDVINI